MNKELDLSLSWDVEQKHIYLDNGDKIYGHKAIVRNDNGTILSVMKDTYSPMVNSEFANSVNQIKEISGFNLAGFNEFKNGRKVLAFLENNQDDLSIGGYKIKNYLLLGNSFDGSTSFFTGTSDVLIRCQNQFSQIIEVNKIRHTKKFKTKLDEYYVYLDTVLNKRKEIYSLFEKLMNIKATPQIQEAMVKFSLNAKELLSGEYSALKQKQMDLLNACMVKEMADLGDNVWGLFNGITYLATHEIETKNATFGNVFGQAADINNRAFQFAKSLVI